MSDCPDVVVVGGGVVGLACAYFLRERGLGVCLVERGLPGGGTSSATGGGIRRQFATRSGLSLSLASWPIWQTFRERFGIDIDYRAIGYLNLARTPDAVRRLADATDLQHTAGVPSERLDREALVHRWPWLASTDFVAGGHLATDGFANPHRVIEGLLQAARALGVTLQVGTEVRSLLRSGARVSGVETTNGPLPAGCVVNAAGAWAPEIVRMAGGHLPFAARCLSLVICDVRRALPVGMPWLYDHDAGVHLRPDAPGRLLAGGLLREAAWESPGAVPPRPDPAWMARVLSQCQRSFGLFELDDLKPVSAWSGFFSGLPDAAPVMDWSVPGLLTVAGFAGTGLMHAPAAAIAAAEWIAEGAPRSLDVSPFSQRRIFAAEARLGDAVF